MQFTIPVSAMPDFSARIAKLNRRAVKLGCDPIVCTVTDTVIVERSHSWKDGDGDEHTRKYKAPANVIEVTGTAPKLEGFEFIARVEYLADKKSTLFHTVPGTDTKIDERFRSLLPSVCEHCNKVRTRKETFIVREVVTDKQTQVGRQCLADFTGINDVSKAVGRAAWLHTFESLEGEFRNFGGAAIEGVDTLEVLALTSAYIEGLGWVPKSASSEMQPATATLVSRHFWERLTSQEKAEVAHYEVNAKAEKHVERATRVIAWIKDELAHKARSDYEMNLVTLVTLELCERKHIGIVASAVSAYQRAHNQKVEYAKRNEEKKNSQHVGAIGQRLRNIKGKVEFVRMMESDWGASTLLKIMGADGNLYTWFASGDKDFVTGAEVVFTGTIKRHSEYNGIKETTLSRCVVDIMEDAK